MTGIVYAADPARLFALQYAYSFPEKRERSHARTHTPSARTLYVNPPSREHVFVFRVYLCSVLVCCAHGEHMFDTETHTHARTPKIQACNYKSVACIENTHTHARELRTLSAYVSVSGFFSGFLVPANQHCDLCVAGHQMAIIRYSYVLCVSDNCQFGANAARTIDAYQLANWQTHTQGHAHTRTYYRKYCDP